MYRRNSDTGSPQIASPAGAGEHVRDTYRVRGGRRGGWAAMGSGGQRGAAVGRERGQTSLLQADGGSAAVRRVFDGSLTEPLRCGASTCVSQALRSDAPTAEQSASTAPLAPVPHCRPRGPPALRESPGRRTCYTQYTEHTGRDRHRPQAAPAQQTVRREARGVGVKPRIVAVAGDAVNCCSSRRSCRRCGEEVTKCEARARPHLGGRGQVMHFHPQA